MKHILNNIHRSALVALARIQSVERLGEAGHRIQSDARIMESRILEAAKRFEALVGSIETEFSIEIQPALDTHWTPQERRAAMEETVAHHALRADRTPAIYNVPLYGGNVKVVASSPEDAMMKIDRKNGSTPLGYGVSFIEHLEPVWNDYTFTEVEIHISGPEAGVLKRLIELKFPNIEVTMDPVAGYLSRTQVATVTGENAADVSGWIESYYEVAFNPSIEKYLPQV